MRRIVTAGEKKAREVLVANRDKLEAITQALMEYETITGEEVNAVMRGEKIVRTTDDEETKGPAGPAVPAAGKSPPAPRRSPAPAAWSPIRRRERQPQGLKLAAPSAVGRNKATAALRRLSGTSTGEGASAQCATAYCALLIWPLPPRHEAVGWVSAATAGEIGCRRRSARNPTLPHALLPRAHSRRILFLHDNVGLRAE